ncbi:hypothetical protein BpHYR1_052674 [Brachionus plicatilis]|uniref:Uncharacterized protein n=1 Tax=Brachionus plicatilis TaxID=10195 RepID=A0A3M7QF44_BRAPC|nr:hypothetical protein BpHYR1_052674 [Brachionus plicatilis]
MVDDCSLSHRLNFECLIRSASKLGLGLESTFLADLYKFRIIFAHLKNEDLAIFKFDSKLVDICLVIIQLIGDQLKNKFINCKWRKIYYFIIEPAYQFLIKYFKKDDKILRGNFSSNFFDEKANAHHVFPKIFNTCLEIRTEKIKESFTELSLLK